MNALGGVHSVIVCLINGCETTVPKVWQYEKNKNWREIIMPEKRRPGTSEIL